MNMKKILLIDQDQKFIGDLQAKFARRYEILATEDYETAIHLCRSIDIDLLLARLPPASTICTHDKLKKMLKKLRRGKYSNITKVLTVSEQSENQVEEYLKLGIAAIVVNVGEIDRWLK